MDKNSKLNIVEDEIDIRELVKTIISERRTIFFSTSIISLIALLYCLFIPNIYKSTAILVPSDSSNSISGYLSSYSGLASLAGINLPSDGVESNSVKAIEKLNSLSFFENHIMPQIFLPDLMALKSWDYESNKLIYKKNTYNFDTGKWIRDYSYPQKQKPSAQESFEEFLDNHLIISEDTVTGFISLSILHKSPFIAKNWAELMIDEINAFYREKDKLESQKAVAYLNEQISMTNLSEIKQAIAELLQQETQKLTLIEANTAYVFDYIDPPAIMEEEDQPKRLIIMALSIFFGFIASIIIVLVKSYLVKKVKV